MSTPSWQPDPFHRHEYRWWDSQNWTEHVSDHGVAGIDPLHTPTAPPHPTWAAPHLDPPAPAATVPLAAAPSTGQKKQRGALVAVAALVAAALGVGGFLLLRGDTETTTLGQTTDPSTETIDPRNVPGSTVAPTTAAPTTAAPTTAAPTTAAPTTVPATTVAPLSDDDQLQAAMPTEGDVPADWSLYSDVTWGHEPSTDSGLCNGPNTTAIAIGAASTAEIDGTTFDLPSGAWFGIEAYSFTSPAAATAFIAANAAQAAGCTTTPVTIEVPESELQVFADPVDTVWRVDLYAGSAPEAAGVADEVLMVTASQHYSTVLDGDTYSYVLGSERRLERYGRFVFEYWTDGQYGYTGFGNGSPDWVFTPTAADVAVAADAVRPGIRDRLGA